MVICYVCVGIYSMAGRVVLCAVMCSLFIVMYSDVIERVYTVINNECIVICNDVIGSFCTVIGNVRTIQEYIVT